MEEELGMCKLTGIVLTRSVFFGWGISMDEGGIML
jgi:hypothetical protein